MRLASDRRVFSAQVFRAYVNPLYVLEPLRVHPNFDGLVELLKELERDNRDFQLANDVPRDERVKDLFCDIERRKVLHLEYEMS